MKSSTKVLLTEIKGFLFKILLPSVLILVSHSLRAQTTTAIQMDMEWLSSTSNTADFQIRLKNAGTSAVTFNGLIIRGVHAPGLTTGTISWKALNNNTLPGWLNWPNTGTTNLPYNSTTRKLNFSSSNSIFNSSTAQAIPSGAGVVVGTFRISTTSTWSPNSDFGFVWEMTSGGVVGYVDGATFVTNIQHYGVSGGTICGQCLTVTAPSVQTLNQTAPPSSSLLTGDATICSGASTNLSVAVTDGTAPYTVTVTDGTNNYSATSASPVSIPVSPTSTSTYSIVSVTGGGTGTGNSGSATVTVTPATTTGSITTSICAGDSYVWPANGQTYTTPQSGLILVSGCNTATLNLTVAPATTTGSVTTSICTGASYTWPANGQTYSTPQSGLTVISGCNTATLNLSVTSETTSGSVTTSICSGSSYTWPANGQTYTTAQSGVTVIAGCNTATLNLTVTPIPTQPTGLACYQTAVFNNTTCIWDVTGTQATAPTGLACYQTAVFNNTTCVWDVSGTQASAPTGLACYQTAVFNNTTCVWDVTGTQAVQPTLACYQTATFNTTSCAWDVSGTQTSNTTTVTGVSGSYTWANNGQTYTVSGIYTGNDVNCVAQVLDLSISASTTASIRMDMEWLSSTASTADFQIRLTNTGSIPVKFNALIIRGVHSPSITTGAITWKALNDNTLPGWLNWPNTGTANLPYISSQRKLNFSSSTGIFTSATAQAIPSGSGVVMGTFRMSTTTNWVPNSNFGFVWEMTSGGVVGYVNGASTVTNIQPFGTVSTATTCASCLAVTASSSQPLNTVGSLSATLSGDATICATSSTNLSVAVSGGQAPYTVTVTDGTNNYTATGASPLSIAVSPSATSTYSISSITGGITGTGTGTATVTVTPIPTQPTVACYQTAAFNNTTCVWDVTGTQASAPTGLACYQTAVFNNTTCIWDVTGTQATAPTGLACYQTATFNNTTCIWDVTGTQATAPTGLACYQTAVFNNTTCVWDVSGTQAIAPTGLACYQTAVFNNTTCVWDVTGTQAVQPTLACYQTATFNTTSCAWDVSGTQTSNTTTVTGVSGSYTWANNGQTYTVSGIYTGNDVNCVAQVLDLSISASTTASIRMDMEWLSSTASTADFQIRLTNTGSIPVKFNALIIRGVHSPSITTGAITWKALNDNTLPGWLNWPNTGTANLPYISSQRKLNFSSSNGIFTSATAQAIPSGSGVVMGTFRMSTTTNWVPNSNFGFVWEMTSGGVVGYVNGASTVTNIQPFGTVSTATTCASCLAVTASSSQPLNTVGSLSATLSGDATICATSSTNLSVAVSGGQAPYTVTVTDGTNNYTATGASPLSIAVSPSATSTYSISSITGGITGTGTGTATVTVTPIPTQPTVACYQTATFNNTTCVWDVTGTQASSPTGLACYQTAVFNNTTCIWDVTGTQATAPTGLACYQTAVFNNTTCIWDVTGTQASAPTGLACYQTAVFNNTTCVWDVSGTQASAPTGLACYQTAVFNNTTCVWDVTGTQAVQPTLACYQTATFNTTSCAWDVSGTQTSNTTTVTGVSGSYTWANNGQTYTVSGIYTGNDVNCVAQVLDLSISASTTASIRMDMEWLSSTASTADFQIRLTNTGSIPVKFNALIIRGVHSPSITTGAITWKALNDNTLPGWLNWPNTGTANLPYISSQRKLNFSSSNGIFTSATAQAIPSGSGVVMGTFRMSTTTNWVPNSNFGFVWEMTSGGVVGYVNGASTVTNIQPFGTVSTATTCASCLAVTASSSQPLNTVGSLSATLSGDATICATSSTNLSVAVSGGQAPYTVTVTDGTNNYTATGASPLSIAVSPSATSTYSISSITGGITGTGTGTATVTVTPIPTQPTVACYQTATFNNTTCVWDVTGTQASSPTGLACYQTAVFNNTTCIWDVTGTQAIAPTGLACYQTAGFNSTTCVWDVTGTQATAPTGLACYQTAVFNNTTCVWDVSGTQATAPTGLACYQTAVFNNTTCVWDVTGTQAVQPTLACYQTATFNTTSCAWDVSGTQTSNTTTVTGVSGSYTWANNGQTYTVSGIYTGNDVNCVAQVLDLSISASTTASIRMDMEWLSSTASTADFQIRLTNTGSIPVKFNALIIRGVHSPSITTGAITWKALNDNTLPGWLNWPNTGTANLPYISSQRKLNFSSSNGIFTSATAQAIPSGSGVVMGTFRMSTTTNWVPNSNFGFVWEMTSGGVVGYVNGASTVTNIQPFGTVSTATTCASCLAVTASSSQPLNTVGSLSATLSGDATICATSSTNLSVAVSGGQAPYTVTVTDGTNNYTATGASPLSIAVSPSATSTYSISSITGGITGTGTGTATVTVTPIPTQPTVACYQTATFNNTTCVWDVTGTQASSPTGLACYQTAVFNNTTCIWDVTGTQATAPTGLACYQTAVFNNTTCIWDVTGTQASAPTGLACYQTAVFNNTTCVWDVTGTQAAQPTLACYQTAVFNNTTCVWDVSGTQTSNTTTVTGVSGSYTWANNGQTYTVSGIYTGIDVNCVAQVLNLSINSSIRMDMEWLSSTASTADFQIRLTNTGSIPVKFNALIIRGVHSPSITTGAITWKALNDNTLPGWLNWPNTGTANLPYISSQRKLNFSSSNGIFTSATAQAIPSGSGVVMGTFRMSTTTNWVPNSNFGFVWEMTSGGVVGYVNGASTVTNIQPFGTTSTATICASCLAVTASSSQPLNTVGSLSATLSGDATICATNSTNLSVAVSGGQAPYTVTVTDGTNNYTATGASPLSIAVSPSATSTYSISSVTGGIAGTGTGTATVTVTPIPTQPTVACYQTAAFNNTTCVWDVTGTQATAPTGLACYQTAVFNNTTCIWDVTGTQATAPTGLACYQTAVFNNTTCVWDVSGTQASAPTGLACYQTAVFNNTTCVWDVTGTQAVQPTLACYQTATFNTTSCAWDVSGTQTSNTTTVTGVSGSYTWANNGQTYTVSGIYTGIDVNCVAQVLNLSINSSIRMDMEWLSSTASTADFQIRLTNTGSIPVKFNALIIRGVHSPSITTGAITWKALNDNTLPGWLNWPNTGTANLPYISSQRKLNFSSSNGIFTSATAQAIPSGSGVVMGTFRMSTTTNWVPNSNFGFVWEMTSGGVVGYVNGASTVTNIQPFGTTSTATTCASCLAVTASSSQPLNTVGSLSATLSGDATICATNSTNLSVAVSGGQAPYTVTVTDGTNNYTATGASPLSIAVSPSATSTYSISSVTGGIAGTGTGTATVTVTPIPTQPTVACYQTAAFNNTTCVWDVTGTQATAPTGLACYQTAVFNNTTCIWDVTGTQATAPTGLACYQTAVFNNTTCIWDVTGTQASAPTGLACYQTAVFNNTTCVWDVTGTQAAQPTLACYQTAVFNNTTCVWDVSGTQTSNTTTVTGVNGSYTWANNGQTYTVSGIYTGIDVNCVAQVLNLTVTPVTVGILNLKVYLEGYYTVGGQMRSALVNSGVSSNTSISDTIKIQLRSQSSPNTVVFSSDVLLSTNGITSLSIPANLVGGNYYVAVYHRNSLETWSTNPISFTTNTSYDFTISNSQSFGNVSKQVEPGVWAIYSGDQNQDGVINTSDLTAVSTEASLFSFGYIKTDLTGDGAIDGFDLGLADNNSSASIVSIHP